MNKHFTKLLLFALLFFGWTSSKGQVFFLNEDFSGTTGNTPPTGWSNNTLAGDPTFDTWRFNNPSGRGINAPISSPAAIFDSDGYSINGNDENVTLESPSFNTTGIPAITLRFDHQFESGAGGEAFVEVWDGTSWNEVYSTTAQVATTTEDINISAFAANRADVQVRFRWTGDYSWWWLVDNVQVFYTVDAQPLSVEAPTSICGATSDSIKVAVRNNSAFTLLNVPVTIEMSGLLSGIQRDTIDSIPASSVAQASFAGGNTTGAGTLNVNAWTTLAGDDNNANDTIKGFSLNIIGTPADPTFTVGSRCGAGSVMLSANTTLNTDSIIWYANNPPTSAALSVDRVLNTPSISTTRDFYAYALRGDISSNQLTTTLAKGNGNTGTMFDVTPKKNIVLDSLTFVEDVTATGNYQIRVYYKQGTYVGNNANAGAWTTLGTYTVASVGADVPLTFDVDDLKLTGGQVYGMYITIISGPQTTLAYTNGTNTYSDANVDIQTGIGTGALFPAFFNNPRSWNGRLHYRLEGCLSNGVAVKATINDVAAGTTLSGKIGSKGTFNGGTLTATDVNASPDSIIYNLVTPTGFNDADYGSGGTWEVSSIAAETMGGTTVPSSMYSLVVPTSLSGGEFRLHTDTTFNDSTIKVDVNVRRLDNGCDTTITKYIYIAPRPKARFNGAAVCRGDVTLFDDASFLQVGTLTYAWDFGVTPKVTSDLANPFYKYTAAGTYNVTLIVESDKGYKDSIIQAIVVNEVPAADFEVTNACEGTALNFQDNSVLPAGTPVYTWAFGDGNTGSGASTSNLYTQPGIYPVKMTVEVNGCADEITKYGTQAPRSTPDFSFTALQCDNAKVDFTNNSTAPTFGTSAYTWKLGDGRVENRTDLSYTYNAFQTYDVVLISRTDLGCIDSITKSLTLKESPVTDFNVQGSTCSDEVLTFDNITTQPAGGTPNTYEWEFGDANTSTDVSPSHQYVGPGVKTITLTARNANGCEGTIMKDVTIDLKPNADFVTKDVCLGTESKFTNNSNIGDASPLTYEWTIGGNTSTTTDESITYTTDGVKNVRLITTSTSGCTDTANRTVEVFPQPNPVINIASQLSFDGAFSFATNTSGSSYRWVFGDGSTATTQNANYKYPIDGRYVVSLIITSDKGCVGLATDTLFVNRLGVQDDYLAGNIKLYPNPGNGSFDLEFNSIDASEIKSVVVLNNLGQRVAVLDTKAIAANKLAIDIANEAAGIYFIQVETINGKASFKYNLVK